MILLAIMLPFTFVGIMVLMMIRKKFGRINPSLFWICLVVFLIVESVFVYFIFVQPIMKERAILDSGISAPAKILSVKETGNVSNRNPEVNMTLEIQPKGAPSYEADTTLVLHQIDIPKYVSGVMVVALLDPNDKTNLLIEGINVPEKNGKNINWILVAIIIGIIFIIDYFLFIKPRLKKINK